MYNKLVDAFPKHQLFYLVGGFYFVVFAGIAALLADPVIGIQNETKDPFRLIGERDGRSVPDWLRCGTRF